MIAQHVREEDGMKEGKYGEGVHNRYFCDIRYYVHFGIFNCILFCVSCYSPIKNNLF